MNCVPDESAAMLGPNGTYIKNSLYLHRSAWENGKLYNRFSLLSPIYFSMLTNLNVSAQGGSIFSIHHFLLHCINTNIYVLVYVLLYVFAYFLYLWYRRPLSTFTSFTPHLFHSSIFNILIYSSLFFYLIKHLCWMTSLRCLVSLHSRILIK